MIRNRTYINRQEYVDSNNETNAMLSRLILDYTDLPPRSIDNNVASTEQLCLLCGLNRRTSRRIAKAVFRVLTYFPPTRLVEQACFLVPANFGWAIEFRFLTDPIVLNAPQDPSLDLRTEGSLRRIGEKLESFEISGGPNEGFSIVFSQSLPAEFVLPTNRELKSWGRIGASGNWEEAFEILSKGYDATRNKLSQLRDGISIRREMLDDDQQQTNTILSLIASKTDNAVLLLNAEGNIEWLNRACCQTFAVDTRKTLGLNVSELFFEPGSETDNDQHAAKTGFLASLANQRSFSVEYAQESDLAISLWTAFQLTPVRDEHDSIVRWIAIGSDVTQRRKAELAMQAAKNVAESANKAKSEFLAMMSHEIRTPMNAIMGMTELTLGTKLTAEQRDFLNTAQNSAQSLLQILNDILDLSKVEASQMKIEQVDFNLADLVRDTLDTMGFLAEAKGITLRCQFPVEIPQQLVGDPVRIRQIIVNLVGNAIKFTLEGEVEFCCQLTDTNLENATIHFSVHDTGVGIAEEKTSRIFEAFYQTDTSVTRNFGGTGLGLAITSELVRLIGGRIWVESKLGFGSTFHFVVTFPKTTRPSLGPAKKSLERLQGKTALLVARDEPIRRFLQAAMTQWGVEVQQAGTIAEANQLLTGKNQAKFDFAIVDSLNGLNRTLQTSTKSLAIVLIVAAQERKKKTKQLRELEITEFLVKPISANSLCSALQNALGPSVESLADVTHNSVLSKPTDTPIVALVVDDHPSNRTLASEILRRRGHTCFQAGSGEQAIELLKHHKCDVVLMDVQMPDLDGLQTTQRIREFPDSNAFVPIIALTAYVTQADRQKCIDAGMDDYLAKPLSSRDLLEKVENWGLTSRTSNPRSKTSQDLAEPLMVQDVPNWAAQVAREVAVSINDVSDPTDRPSEIKQDQDVLKSAPLSTPGTDSDRELDESSLFVNALVRLGGDEELLRLQMGFFLDETPQLMHNIATAIKEKNSKTLHLNAHRLKGLVRSYDDLLAEELATNLENKGRQGIFENADSTLSLLTACIETLRRQIEDRISQSG